ncbi:unnamed protein product [Arabis nemorensis]|uniref:Uncharacterized protein n=1 Tax=Arabis nemorensis TaxID=586526 RepID=A0A565C0R6_9BRAS|nr:unnamed protein product [Arabis nemorensis]
MSVASSLPRRRDSMPFSRINLNSSPINFPPAPFQNPPRTHFPNHVTRSRNVGYHAAPAVETPTFQFMPMTNTNNINFVIGQPRFEPQPLQPNLQPFQPQPQPQPQVHVVDAEMSVEDDVRTLPLIQQLEREWPGIAVMEDNEEEDLMDLKLKL